MKINFVTALSAYELEDAVIETLADKGFNLIARVNSKAQLFELIKTMPSDERVLVVYDEIIALSNGEKKQLQTEQFSALELESDQKLDHESFLSQVYERLRKPEKSETAFEGRTTRAMSRNGNWIGVTGSSSAPGITTVAINLAAELSTNHLTTLVDGDVRRSDIGIKLGVKSQDRSIQLSESLRLINLSQVEPSVSNKIIESVMSEPVTEVEKFCIDLGTAPELRVAISDRRRTGQEFVEKLQLCSQLLYVVQPENHSLSEMEHFYFQLCEFYPEAQVTFVLNKSATSSRHQAIKKSFRRKIEEMQVKQKHFIVPMDYALVDRAQGRFATVSEVAPRSTLRKAYQELSIYLLKST